MDSSIETAGGDAPSVSACVSVGKAAPVPSKAPVFSGIMGLVSEGSVLPCPPGRLVSGCVGGVSACGFSVTGGCAVVAIDWRPACSAVTA